MLPTFACPVCMGPPGHDTTQAVTIAILAMLGFLFPVLLGIVGFIFHMARKAKQHHAEGDGLPDSTLPNV